MPNPNMVLVLRLNKTLIMESSNIEIPKSTKTGLVGFLPVYKSITAAMKAGYKRREMVKVEETKVVKL